MGDRRQLLLYEDDELEPFLYVYTHWGGSELKAVVANGLERGLSRWGDPPYMARILVSEVFMPDIDGTTNFGLSGKNIDSEHDDIHVHLNSRRVAIADQVWEYEEFIRDFGPEQDP